MVRPHIQVILADETIPPALRAALQRTHATTGFWPLSEALRSTDAPIADAIVVVVPPDAAEAPGALRILFDRLAEHPRATLVLSSDGREMPPLTHPPTLPVTFFSGHDQNDLSGRLSTMLEMKTSLDSLHRGLMAHRRSGENIAQRYVNQLRLASQVQREFLPEQLPRFGRASFNVIFRPVDYVSGDIYDVHRLDEDHVGIAVADATGHGIPAALLTVYIKRALRGKEIENGTYRILAPDEVLHRLNEDILDAHLTECPFVAAVYAVLNIRTLEVRLARGGAPYPLCRRADGRVDVLESEGGVVGVLPNSRFEVCDVQLEPGDSLILYSDGLERIVAPQLTARDLPDRLLRAAERVAGWRRRDNVEAIAARAGNSDEAETATAVATLADEGAAATSRSNGRGPASSRSLTTAATGTPAQANRSPGGATQLRAAAHALVTESAWCGTLRTAGTPAALEQIAGRQRTLRRMGYPLDDLTVLALQIDA